MLAPSAVNTMNDFTKEELQGIYWHFEYYLECLEPKFGKNNCIERADLMNKIKSMIDNYCEHPKFLVTHDYDVNECTKCGELFI